MSTSAWDAKHPKINQYRSAIEWEKIHQSRQWGVWPDIHCVRQVKKFMHGRKFARALDIGAGVGANSRMMNDEGMLVTAMDSSPTAIDRMLEVAPGVSRVIADATEVTFDTEEFDFVLDNFALTYVQEPPWNRIMSWLKPGGG